MAVIDYPKDCWSVGAAGDASGKDIVNGCATNSSNNFSSDTPTAKKPNNFFTLSTITLISTLVAFIFISTGAAASEAHQTLPQSSPADLQGKREDLFSSTSKLEDLVEHELQIVELLDTFVEYTVSRTNIIKS